MDFLLFVLHVIAFIIGFALVIYTLLSAIRTFVMPRSARDALTRGVFLASRKVFDMWIKRAKTYEERDNAMALYAPITLLIMPAAWLLLVMIGFMGMFWAFRTTSLSTAFTRDALQDAFTVSGSSLLTLGFAKQDGFVATALSFSEAAIGLVLVALLIAYLPTMYASFQRRELMVNMLEVRAGNPPSAVDLFSRLFGLKRIDTLTNLWAQWETWFADLDESHTSLAALTFFRSPNPHRSWVTAAGAILDAAALAQSTIDMPNDPQASLTIRAGYLALRHIAEFFGMDYEADPKPTDPISISRFEFNMACRQMSEAGVPLKDDRDQAWRDYAGWRVNYDVVLLKLAALTMAPYAPWSSDRSVRSMGSRAMSVARILANPTNRPSSPHSSPTTADILESIAQNAENVEA